MMLHWSGRGWGQGTRFYGLLFTALGNFNELEECQAAEVFWLSTVQGVRRWCHGGGECGGGAGSRRLCNSILRFIDWAVHPWAVGFTQIYLPRNVDAGRVCVSQG